MTMKKISAIMFLGLTTFMLAGSFSPAYSGALPPPTTMFDYCQTTPLVSQAITPNIFFTLDSSGSMAWAAYSYGDRDNNGDGILDNYNPSVAYEGYFTPDRYYKTDTNGIYIETLPSGIPCTCTCTNWRCRSSNIGGCVQNAHGCTTGRNRWACCTAQTCTGDCNLNTGNYLNYAHMARADLLRWALTGGTPSTCTGTQTFNSAQCDPELWSQSGNDVKVGSVCNDALIINDLGTLVGGCILRAYDGTQVKVPWDRVYGGLAFTFEGLSLSPRMGAMSYNGSSVLPQQVYIGDFTAPNSTNVLFPYMNLITHINSTVPANTTPTGPAMWDAMNYYAQRSPQFGGLPVQSGSGDRWKNPMYVCDQGGMNCSFVPCSGNYVVLISDGQWNNPGCNIGNSPTCTPANASSASADPVVPAYCMHAGYTNNTSDPPTPSKVSAVYTIGLFLGGTGENALKNVAMYGSYDNTAKAWPDSLTGFPAGACTMADCGAGSGSACTSLPASSPDWDKNGDNVPDTFYNASDALGIKNTILDAVLDILRRTASGTAVSILASGEGSGANLLQAFFYPKKAFQDQEISWIGEMQNLWYYLDPTFQRSTIREDTVRDNRLDLIDDYVVHFRFDTIMNKTRADRYKDTYDMVTGDWLSSTYVDTVDLEKTANLWEAGSLLWLRDPVATPRRLGTTITGNSLMPFAPVSAGLLQNYLQAADAAEAAKIIGYVLGVDFAGYRSRTVTIPTVDNIPRVWKLGDIVSSTPKLQSWIRLNTYDSDPAVGYSDETYQSYIESLNYRTRGMTYVGANDGILHAFKLGTQAEINNPGDRFLIAQLCEDFNGNGRCDGGETPGVNLGKESWGYIPRNALPYLKYLTDPTYCHIYSVDGTPYLFDASINPPGGCAGDYSTCVRKTQYISGTNSLDMNNTSWRTVLVGGMGLGGACKGTNDTCSNCVRTPILDPADNTKSLGYSSYFALDITDQENPRLLWEFSDPALGFATTGPVIVRTGDRNSNGKWFAVFASGPTGPIDTAAHQFLGNSDQNLKLFILDLTTGALLRTIDTGIQNAFGGSLFNATVDTDRWIIGRTGNYQDDVFYMGYTKPSGTDWVGGVLRITTKESTDPNNWVLSTFIDGIGPVSAAVSHLQDRKNHKLWLYFGTGRYFYKIGTLIDDADALPLGKRAIYGVKDPCYRGDDSFDPNCSTPVAIGSLTDATTVLPTTEPASGWVIYLDASGTSYKSERVVTNPLAAFTGAVFFTTFSPTADICGFSGNSFLWAVGYNTGGTAPSSALMGTALVQVSTGEIKEIKLSEAFPADAAHKSGRRTTAFQGMPPQGQGLAVVVRPRPIRKILHMQER